MLVEHDALDALLRGAVLAIVALFWIVIQIRIVGLRSLSKMTSFDFVMTIALGSLVANASQADDWRSFYQPLAAMAGLFFIQWLTARLRLTSNRIERTLQNEPALLMRDGKFLRDAMARTRVTESDLRAKLREANVLDLSQVRAAVLETTGDVSILHGDHLNEALLEGVRRTRD